jgi:uncharacterized protein YuzE
MAETGKIVGFELSISGREDGTLEAAYIRLRKGKVHRTRELIEDTLMADYDGNGNLLGIELLAPVRLADLTKQVEQSQRPSFRKFVQGCAPQALVHA